MTIISPDYFDEQQLAIEKLIAAGDIEAYALLREFEFVQSDLFLADLCYDSSLAVSLHSYEMTEKGAEYLYSPGYGVIAVRAEKKEELINLLGRHNLVSEAKKKNSSKRQAEKFAQGYASGAGFNVTSPSPASFISTLDIENRSPVMDAEVSNIEPTKHKSEPVIHKDVDNRSELKDDHRYDWLWPFVFLGSLFLAFKYGFAFEKAYPGVLGKVFLFSIAAIIVFFIGKFLLKDGVSALPKQSGTLVKRLFWFVVIISLIGMLGDCSGGSGFNIDSIRK